MEKKEYIKILVITCGLAASSIGLCNNCAGVFYTSVSSDLDVLRGSFAFHATLSLLASAITSLYVPGLTEKYHYRSVLVLGVIMSVSSTFFMGFSRNLLSFYILGTLRGIGVGLYGTCPVTILINQWFHEKNGMAIGMALSFSGLSGALFSPILSRIIHQWGWQRAYIFMSISILLLALPVFLLPFSMTPQEQGLKPYGYKVSQMKKEDEETKNSRFSYFHISFLFLCLFAALHTSISGIAQHFSGYTLSIGLGETIGASLMSCSMLGNIVTKLLIGCISDRIGSIKACVSMMTINIFSLCLLVSGNNPVLLMAAAFLFGSVYSVGAVGIPLLTRHFFGNRNYGKAFAVVGFFTSLGSASSLAAIGYLYDMTGTYQYAFGIAILIHVVNGILLISASRLNRTPC